MDTVIIIFVIVFFIVFAVLFTLQSIAAAKRNKEIREGGIETDAVVTRIEESRSVDDDGCVSVSYSLYAAFRTQEGQTVEARLGSGKAVDTKINHKGWEKGLYEGCKVRVMYLPERPDYAILVR